MPQKSVNNLSEPFIYYVKQVMGKGAKPKYYTLWEEGEWQIMMYDSDGRERRPDVIAYFKQETN